MELSTKKTRPRLTFEIYIPEQAAPISKMMQTVDVLRSAKPDFVLATADHRHGTGLERAVEFASMIQSEGGIPGAVLIPSICYTRTRLKLQLQQMKRRGITRILAVRGDGMRPDFEHADFPSAAELIEFIKEVDPEFRVASGCFLENHPESLGIVTDVWQLRRQADAGACRMITRMFYSFRYFEAVQNRLEIAGVYLPMDAGIMPILRKEAVSLLRQDFGVRLPRSFAQRLAQYEDDPKGFYEEGVKYANEQIRRLVATSAPGVHIFSHNDSELITRLSHGFYDAVSDFQAGTLAQEFLSKA